jgi:hypothetical protein
MKRQMAKFAAMTMVLGAAWLVAAHARQNSSTEKKPAEAQMQAPQPGPEMERLKFLIGTWDMKAEYVKSPMVPEGGRDDGWYKAQPGPGGFSIIADFEGDGPMGKEIGHEVLSWDPKQNAYTTVTVGNSFPGAIIGSSRWEGDTLVTQIPFDAGGVTMHLRSVYSNIQEKSTHIEEFSESRDGSYKLIYTADATKK